MAENCSNCNALIAGNYCSDCGQKVKLERINGHYIKHEIEHVLHFEKGILYTIKALLLHPGASVREFISENRNRLVKPIIFIVVTSLIYSLTAHFFHIEEGYINIEEAQKASAVNYLNQWVQGHYGYANLIMGIFIAAWVRLFFRKHDVNFYEIVILLCFVIGIEMLLCALFALLEGTTHLALLPIASVVALIYTTWGIGNFFDGKKAVNYVKAFFAYVLGTVSFSVAILIIGTVVDLLLKH
ncbi:MULTISPECIES: DUF3667 domain-containing protein [unclassified Sphingobacterium]|uniref:DUF3667 domain-containing protein n=1 Tax=unclassified Sphingobacterium TaxID=2609468 RepID=UPI0025CEE750|nr:MULTISPECIES: DUF3667 domain-containing protein [unclassified Sphingobacterium]